MDLLPPKERLFLSARERRQTFDSKITLKEGLKGLSAFFLCGGFVDIPIKYEHYGEGAVGFGPDIYFLRGFRNLSQHNIFCLHNKKGIGGVVSW